MFVKHCFGVFTLYSSSKIHLGVLVTLFLLTKLINLEISSFYNGYVADCIDFILRQYF